MKHILYGIHPVEALLQTHPEWIVQVFVQKQRRDSRIEKLIEQVKAQGISVQAIDRDRLNQVVDDNVVHQGVVAECKQLPRYDESDLEPLLQSIDGPALFLILDGIQDPHNLGACLRTANAMGVHGVIVPKDRAVGITPVVNKVSCGAAILTPFIQVTNLARTMEALKKQGIWIVGTTAETDKTIQEMDLKDAMAIVMGAEGKGLRKLTAQHCDFLAKIPMFGDVESLNVSVATGMCLYEVNRQRAYLRIP